MSRTVLHTAPAFALLLAAVLACATACEPEPRDNPFEPNDPDSTDTTETSAALTYEGLPGLQDQLFAPTCANSGCHDSTFEPDFRTLGSTYATLVDQPVIKQDPDGHYTTRVVPGDTAASALLLRLTRDIDGTSGVMPLAVEPDSRYHAQRDTLIAFVRQWIAEGANRSE